MVIVANVTFRLGICRLVAVVRIALDQAFDIICPGRGPDERILRLQAFGNAGNLTVVFGVHLDQRIRFGADFRGEPVVSDGRDLHMAFVPPGSSGRCSGCDREN